MTKVRVNISGSQTVFYNQTKEISEEKFHEYVSLLDDIKCGKVAEAKLSEFAESLIDLSDVNDSGDIENFEIVHPMLGADGG
jgi:hypothetical protein